jgi:hypothetical protein
MVVKTLLARAIKIIEANLSNLTNNHVKKVVDFIDLDYWKGVQITRRFGFGI